MTKKQADSPAMQLLQHVWSNAQRGNRDSWALLNSAMQDALSLAISHQFLFEEGDFAQLSERFLFGYWGHQDPGGFAEGFYAKACGVGHSAPFGPNRSACISFEKWKGREPFIYKERDCISGVRLACGSRLYWLPDAKSDTRPVLATVTSFAKDGESLTACTYKGNDYPAKIDRRFKITIKALREQNAKVVESVKAAKKQRETEANKETAA